MIEKTIKWAWWMINSMQLTVWIKRLSIGVIMMLIPLVHAAEPVEEKLALAAIEKAVIAKAASLIKLKQTVYQGYDDGESCGSEIALPEITLIDTNKDRKEQITYCFEITNASQVGLSNITLNGIKPELAHTEFLSTNLIPDLLAPQDSVVFYYEYLLEESLVGQFVVTADLVDKEGDSLLAERSVQTAGLIRTDLIVAPPTVNKTVLPKGGKGMLWKLELVNTSEKQDVAVTIFDNTPEATVFDAMPTGEYVSESGIYCEAQGNSSTDACYLESAGEGHPQRIVWKGTIASDFAKLAEDAEHKVIIRFISNAPESEIGDVITSQARTLWGVDQNEILSDNPVTPDLAADSTTYKIHKPIESEPEVMLIPTLSQWGLLLLILLFISVVRGKVK